MTEAVMNFATRVDGGLTYFRFLRLCHFGRCYKFYEYEIYVEQLSLTSLVFLKNDFCLLAIPETK